MARTQEYIITIRTEGSTSDESSKKAPSTATTKDGGKVTPSSKKELSSGQQLTKGILRSAAFGYAKRALGMVTQASISTRHIRTGQVQFQQQQEAVLGYVQEGIGIAESVAMGYAVGNVYGAVISGVASAIFKVGNLSIDAEKVGMQKTVESIGREQALIRAGAGGGRMGKTY